MSVFIRSSPSLPYLYSNNSPVCVGDTLNVLAGDPWLEAPTFYLDPSGNSIPNISSSPYLLIPDMQISMAGIYSVYISSIQGCYSDTLHFDVEVDSCTLNVATIDINQPFIPTLLQCSDPTFKPIFKSANEPYKMQVYDQTGRKVFETNDSKGWDRSTYQGLYYYIITCKSSVYKGRIILR